MYPCKKTFLAFAFLEVPKIATEVRILKKPIKVAFVKNDPLGEAFSVDVFHRTQVT